MDIASVFELSREFLYSSRTISVRNAAIRLGKSESEAIGIIKKLQKLGYLRIVKLKGCGVSCSSCDSCSTVIEKEYNSDDIIISLLYEGAGENDNE